jgi:uncharacterized membrane protein YdjX (TVP38/TMEM64 family)
MKIAWSRVIIVLFVFGLLAIAYRAGVLEQVKEPARLAQTLADLGPKGYLVFIVAYALLQPFGVPGTVFIMAAPLIWPWPIAFALSMAGTMAASVIGFSFARFVARDFVSSRIPERLRKYETALSERGFSTVFTLRLIFWMPPMLHAFLGVSRVTFAQHFFGSLAGYIVPLLLVSYFGQQVWTALRNAPLSAWIGLGLFALSFAGWKLWQARRANGSARSSLR